MKCNKCGSSKIKTRKNYSHGSKSKATISRFCMQCGSADVEVEQPRGRFGRRRR